MIKLAEVYTYIHLADGHVRTGNFSVAVSLLTMANNCIEVIRERMVDPDELISETLNHLKRTNLLRIEDLQQRLLEAAEADTSFAVVELHNETLHEEETFHQLPNEPIRVSLNGQERTLPFSPDEVEEQNLRFHVAQTRVLLDTEYLADLRFFSNHNALMVQRVTEALKAVHGPEVETVRMLLSTMHAECLAAEARMLKTHPAKVRQLQTGLETILNAFRLKISHLSKYERKWNSLVRSARKRRDEGRE